jgi:hypothetical protein
MCELIGRAIEQAIERRRLLGGMGASALAAVLGKPASAAEIAQREATIAQAKSAAAQFGTRLLLLGTAGGPTYWSNTNRRSTSSALVVGDAVYLVDCGDGVEYPRRLRTAALSQRWDAPGRLQPGGGRRQCAATPGGL